MIRNQNLISELNEDINSEKAKDKLHEIIGYINNIAVFSLRENSDDTEDILKLYRAIDEIYYNYTLYLLSGLFRKESDASEVIVAINNKVREFDIQNEGPFLYKQFIKNPFEALIKDIGFIKVLNVLLNKKNEEIILINEIKTDLRENDSVNWIIPRRIIYLCSIELLFKEFQIGLKYSEKTLKDLLFIHKTLTSIKEKFAGEDYKLVINYLLDKVIYSILKIGIVFGGNKYCYLDGDSEKTINNFSKKESLFFDILKITKFLYDPQQYYDQVKEIITNYVNLSRVGNTISLKVNTDYLKGRISDNNQLTDLYKKYKITKTKEDDNEYKTNLLYIGDSLLSLRVSLYKKNPSNSLGKDIKILYHEISGLKHQNYFPLSKYAEYKVYLIKNLLDEKKYKDCEEELDKAKNLINSSMSLFYQDRQNRYFEFNDNDNYFILDEKYQNIGLKRGYCFNLFLLPFNHQKKIKNLESIQKKIFSLEQDLELKRNFSITENKLKSYKNESMTIIGIFTGIVVFVFSELQIFSRIEDLGSIMLLSGIFIAGILILLFGIYFEEKNKARLLFGLSILIICGSIYNYNHYNGNIININKGENLIENLEIRIQQAQAINDKLENYLDKTEETSN